MERHIALVSEALKPSTRRPKTPEGRQPKLHQKPKKSNGGLNTELLNPGHHSEQQLHKLRLYRSLIVMVGSYLERAPKKDQLRRLEIRELIKNTEICLGLREGKLDASQWGDLQIKLDTIAPLKDGELTGDLEALDAIVQAYGDELANPHNRS